MTRRDKRERYERRTAPALAPAVKKRLRERNEAARVHRRMDRAIAAEFHAERRRQPRKLHEPMPSQKALLGHKPRPTFPALVKDRLHREHAERAEKRKARAGL